jgi:hypothetical protein
VTGETIEDPEGFLDQLLREFGPPFH